MQQFPGTLSLGPKSGRQQDRLQLRVATDDLLPGNQSVTRFEPAGCRPTRRPVKIELATQQLGPCDYIRRLPDALVTRQAIRVMAGAQKMGKATGGYDIRRARQQLVRGDDKFVLIYQLLTG
jgi:hypothetical protein